MGLEAVEKLLELIRSTFDLNFLYRSFLGVSEDDLTVEEVIEVLFLFERSF